jgi:hypothetical protein
MKAFACRLYFSYTPTHLCYYYFLENLLWATVSFACEVFFFYDTYRLCGKRYCLRCGGDVWYRLVCIVLSLLLT